MSSVLVVEDEIVLLAVLERLLRSRFYKVLTATNVPDALQLAQQHQPKVLITDFNLGGPLDGLDLCRAFAADISLATAKRIVISGQASKLTGHPNLIDLLIAKPFTAPEFLKALEPILISLKDNPSSLPGTSTCTCS